MTAAFAEQGQQHGQARPLTPGDVLLRPQPGVDPEVVHWLPDSRATGGTSGVELLGEDPVAAPGAAIRDTQTDVLPRGAAAGQMRERPLCLSPPTPWQTGSCGPAEP